MDLINNVSLMLFLILALGLLMGSISFKGISLESSAVIFIALIFGHFGVKLPLVLQQIGLVFFIYSVGIQAGPGFFSSFKKQGATLLILTAIIIFSGAVVTYSLTFFFKVDQNLSVGLFAGALTSTPGLAAAIESTNSPIASIGYGIAYPFGVLGVILFVKIAPKLFRINLREEEIKYNTEITTDFPKVIHKNYVVENPKIFGKSIEELNVRTMTKTNISRVFHNDITVTPTTTIKLYQGDIIKAVGKEEDLKKLELLIGTETAEKIPLDKKFIVKSILVTEKEIVNKSLAEIGLFSNYNATATCIRRSGIDITPTAKTKFQFGDRVTVACSENDLRGILELFGDNKKVLESFPFFSSSIGIILGVLIGLVMIPIPYLNFKLGITGGVLLSSLVLSKVGKTGPIIWNISGQPNQFIRQLGLLFFLASVGTEAGHNIVKTFNKNGFYLFGIGAVITIVPMIVAIIIGHYKFKINFLTLLGALTGGMTSTPALSAMDTISESNAPQIAYASVYPLALVLVVVFSQLLSIL
ncbi:MAG: transporter [Ignavibacteria bacterium]|nr:transporter [Ignavibacteria bacterium]